MRAVLEIFIQRLATGSAGTFTFMGRLDEIRSGCLCGLLATIARQKRLPLFDSEDWNKEQAEVVVHAFIIGLMQSANRASAGILI